MRIYLFIFLLMVGCSSSEIPANIIPQRQMKDVLWDILQADELSSFQIEKDSSLTISTHTAKYYQSIFALHHITRQQFQTSLQFYQSHPPLFKPIVEALQIKAENIRQPLLKKEE